MLVNGKLYLYAFENFHSRMLNYHIGDIGDMRKPRASWTHAAGHQKKGDIGEAGR